MGQGSHALPVVVGIHHRQPMLLDFAAEWAQRWHAPIRVVRVHGFLDEAADLAAAARNSDGPRKQARKVIADARAHLERLGHVTAEYVVEAGSASSVLELESRRAVAVVVGTDHAPWALRLIGGDVARRVSTHAYAPVFVVPEGSVATEGGEVVLEIDEAHVSDGPVIFAFQTAMLTGSGLQVVHVVSRTAYDAASGKAGARLTQIVGRWSARYPEVRVRSALLLGDIEDEVLIASSTAQLVVIGRPNEPDRGPLLGLRVAEQVIRHSRCAVAVVPSDFGAGNR